jgi:hypothetical protein
MARIKADALVNRNVITPAGDADDSSNTPTAAVPAAALPGLVAHARAHTGAGSKRAAPTAPSPPHAKKMRLDTTTGTVATAVAGANPAAAAPAKVSAQVAALEARMKAEKAKTQVAELKAGLAEPQLAAHVAEQAAAEAERKAALTT